jgi:cell division control protein 6
MEGLHVVHSVFTDRETLLHDYVPAKLPHRERELRKLRHYFEPLIRGEAASVKVHLVGGVGAGKTLMCRKVGGIVARESGGRVKFAYVNLAYAHRPYHAMAEIHRQVLGVPAAGLSPEEMLKGILDYLVEEDLYLVAALDEVDAYVAEGRSLKILYMLPRAYELEPKAAGRVSIIYASRSLNWLKKLDDATLDTIGRTSAIQLEAYSLEQVRDIVAYRAELAFRPGALGEDLIDFVAQISMPYGGVRYALEILLEAGTLADYEGSKSVKASHVRTAHASIPKGANGALCPEELSLHKQALLKAIYDALGAYGSAYLPIEEAYSLYKVACEQLNIESEEEEKVRAHIKDLSSEGYIMLRSGAIAVEYPFEKISQVLENLLKKAKGLSNIEGYR